MTRTLPDRARRNEAIAICETCPVKAECLADAMAAETCRTTSRRQGIWGGKTPQQRYAMYRKEVKRNGRKSA